jgi:hypothetical protein
MDIRSHLPWRNSRSSSSSALWSFLYCDMKCWKKLRHLRERRVFGFGWGYRNRVLLNWRQSVELCTYRWAWHEKQKIKSHHSSLQRICWQHIGLRKSKHNCNKGQNGRASSGVQRSRVYSFDELALEFFCWLGVTVIKHIFASTICWQKHLLAISVIGLNLALKIWILTQELCVFMSGAVDAWVCTSISGLYYRAAQVTPLLRLCPLPCRGPGRVLGCSRKPYFQGNGARSFIIYWKTKLTETFLSYIQSSIIEI